MGIKQFGNVCYIGKELEGRVKTLEEKMKKKETAWEMWHRLEKSYGNKFLKKEIPLDESYDGIIHIVNLIDFCDDEQEAIKIMQAIEKELKDES